MNLNFVLSCFNENVSFSKPGDSKVNLRIVQSVEGKSKVHSVDFKMTISGRSGGSNNAVMLVSDPDTLLIDRKATEASINGKENKKIYKDYIDDISGAILYAKDEIKEFLKTEDESSGYDKVQDKFDEFSKLYKSNKKEYNKFIKQAKSKKVNEGGIFDGIEFV